MNYLNCNWGDVNENGKKEIGLHWQNNSSARASRFFVHFFAVTERLQRENTWFLVLWKNVNTRQRLSFSFPEHRYSLLEFNSRENCQHLMNWTRWNKCDNVWNSAASLFKPPITISQYAKTLCTSSTSHKTQMHKPQGKKTAKLSVRLREIVLFHQI